MKQRKVTNKNNDKKAEKMTVEWKSKNYYTQGNLKNTPWNAWRTNAEHQNQYKWYCRKRTLKNGTGLLLCESTKAACCSYREIFCFKIYNNLRKLHTRDKGIWYSRGIPRHINMSVKWKFKHNPSNLCIAQVNTISAWNKVCKVNRSLQRFHQQVLHFILVHVKLWFINLEQYFFCRLFLTIPKLSK